jgi:hypothetical protein
MASVQIWYNLKIAKLLSGIKYRLNSDFNFHLEMTIIVDVIKTRHKTCHKIDLIIPKIWHLTWIVNLSIKYIGVIEDIRFLQTGGICHFIAILFMSHFLRNSDYIISPGKFSNRSGHKMSPVKSINY